MKSRHITLVASNQFVSPEPTIEWATWRAGTPEVLHFIIVEDDQAASESKTWEVIRLKQVATGDQERMMRINRRLRGKKVETEVSSAGEVANLTSSS